MQSTERLYNQFNKQEGDYKSNEARTKGFLALDNNPELVSKGVKYTDNFGNIKVGLNPFEMSLDCDASSQTSALQKIKNEKNKIRMNKQ